MALGWLLEKASPAIARTLRAIPDASSAAVVIPEVPGIPSDHLYRQEPPNLTRLANAQALGSYWQVLPNLPGA